MNAHDPHAPVSRSLCGPQQPWQLRDDSGEWSCALTLPKDGITALWEAGLIPDPYFGRNELALRWVAERDWTMSSEFELDNPRVALVATGLDTVTTVRVNGEVVMQTQNLHRSYRADLSRVARPGRNQMEITFHSSVAEAARRQADQPFYVPSMKDHPQAGAMCPIPHGNMLRKRQCDFGWDWNIALAPFGVDGDLRLEPLDEPRIERLGLTQHHRPGQVVLDVRAQVAQADGQLACFAFHGQTLEVPVQSGQAQVAFTVDQPALWWPRGQGEQVLHTLSVSVGSARAERRVGLRQIELLTPPDEHGAAFKFRVNGREVFAKGANWIPADALSGRITPTKTRALLQSAADAHMNMLRVWGGGRYESDDFYAACDELGLMVWQDFMFSCNLYPSTPEFLAEVDAEVRENVARLHHHACIALWCGDNELVGALTWFKESQAQRDRYLVSYDRLNRCIEVALKSTHPQANWWPSSPSLGPIDFRDGWHVEGQGDMHFWSVWHEGKDFEAYRGVKVRFCSEFGFQSYPSMPVIARFADPQDWNIASPVFESHQKNAGGNARIAETLFRYFRWPQRFEDFVWLSQIQQALAIKTAVTHWRGSKPYCMGTLYWQLNDTWPVCSWSSLNHGGSWKMLHYAAQAFYAPVTVVCRPEGSDWVLRGVNDEPAPQDLSLQAWAVDPQGRRRALGQTQGQVAGAAVDLLRMPQEALAPEELLVFAWTSAHGHVGQDHFAPRPYKQYPLVDSELQLTVEGPRLRVTSRALALFVTVEADREGRFSSNGVLVLPDQPWELHFEPEDPSAEVRFSVRDLYSATMARHHP